MLLTYFIMLISGTFFGLFSHAIGTINLLTTPSLLCEQDVVEFNCTLSSGVTYTSSLASLSINGSTPCISGPAIFNGAVPRLSFTSFGGTTTAPAAQYTISPFLLQDNATQYRCCAVNSAPPFNTEFTSNLSLSLAAPPSSASVNISTTYDSANTCTGNITLTWLAVTSDRTVTSYEVLLNGTNISTLTTPMAMNSYTTGTLNLLEHYATYTVMATSCAGSSTSSPVMFMPPIITTVPITTSTTNSDTLTTTTISSTTQTATLPITTSTLPITTTTTLPITTPTLPITTPTLPITTPTLPITTPTTNFENVTLTVITTSPVNNILANSSTLPTSVSPNQAYCYLPCTTSTDSVTSTPSIIATTASTNYTPIATGSSITIDATSDTLSCSTTPYLIGIIILVLLLLLSILAITILILFIIYLLRKNNSAPKKQQNTNTDDPTNTAHIYNYIDLNALAETNEEKHYYSDMATIVQSNATTTATTTSNTPTTTSAATTNDDTNDRTGYYNVSTYANLS